MTTIMEYAAQFRDARLTWDGLDARHRAAIQRGDSKPGDGVPGQKTAMEAMDAAEEGILEMPAASLEDALLRSCMAHS